METVVKKSRRSGPRPSARGPRPHVWRSGPDLQAHDQYCAWLKHKAQAAYRGEPYELTYQQWADLWNKNNSWIYRGRGGDCLCLTMGDPTIGWHVDNVEIITRKEQLRRQCRNNVGKKYKVRSRYDEQLS